MSNQENTTIRDLRAGAIAHAIRLGKCPRPGQILSGKVQMRSIEQADFEAGRMERAKPESEQVDLEFKVTPEDIRRAKELINSQRATYSEPKMTKVKL